MTIKTKLNIDNKETTLEVLRTPDKKGILIDISSLLPDNNLIIYLKSALYDHDCDYIYLFDTIKETYEITHLENLIPYLTIIKEHINLFVFCRFHVPNQTHYLDQVYAAGADAINLWCNTYKKHQSVIEYAAELWSNGTILFDINLQEDTNDILEKIEFLASKKVIPILKGVPQKTEDELFTIKECLSNAIISNKISLFWINNFPFTQETFISNNIVEKNIANYLQCNIISKSLALGYSNLRRKLIVKVVNDSFNSASL